MICEIYLKMLKKEVKEKYISYKNFSDILKITGVQGVLIIRTKAGLKSARAWRISFCDSHQLVIGHLSSGSYGEQVIFLSLRNEVL